jgi:hypothetical protein
VKVIGASFSAVKVFSATKARDRLALGERITEWIQDQHPHIKETAVLQSSDNEFHCLSVVVFYEAEG